jgi:transposase
MRIMPAPRKYPQELRERAMRLVSEARQENPELWLHQAVARISSRVGVNPDTLRGWCKQAAIDAGERPGTTTGDFQKIKQLESEVRELKRANEILLAASSYFAGARPATAVVIRFGVDDHKDRVRGRADLPGAVRTRCPDRPVQLQRRQEPTGLGRGLPRRAAAGRSDR